MPNLIQEENKLLVKKFRNVEGRIHIEEESPWRMVPLSILEDAPISSHAAFVVSLHFK